MRCKSKNSSLSLQNESGVVMILFALLVFVAVGILALVIDHSRQSLAITNLQKAADAAALSATKKLDGTREGFQNSKLAAILALKQNSLLGIDSNEVNELTLTDGPALLEPVGSKHQGTIGSIGGITVKVERGVMWFDPSIPGRSGEGGNRFVSLEEGQNMDRGDLPIPQQPVLGADVPKSELPMDFYFYGNAVKVTLTQHSLATTFGRVLGASDIKNMSRSSIAVTHGELTKDVAPIAIPLCALRLNPNPYAGIERQALNKIKLKNRCMSQGVATEADPKRELPRVFNASHSPTLKERILKRREGLVRYESYIRPPYYKYDSKHGVSSCVGGSYDGWAHNCKTLPLYGVMGVPSTEPKKFSKAKDIAAAFQNGIKASVGMHFSPMNTLLSFDLAPQYANQIAQAIADENLSNPGAETVTFKDAFTEERSYGGVSKTLAKRNFPFTRTLRPDCSKGGSFDPERRPCLSDLPETPLVDESDPYYDMRITWPTFFKDKYGGNILGKLLMDIQADTTTRQPLDYTNPLCHHPSLPIDSLNNGDPTRHKIKKMLAPVIAPGTAKRPYGRPAMYCNYREVFDDTEAKVYSSSVAPTPASDPVIVGFVPIYIYDLNLTNLDRVKAFQPTPEFIEKTNRNKPLIIARGVKGKTVGLLPPPPNGWKLVSTPYWKDPVTGEVLYDRNTGEWDIRRSSFFKNARNKVKKYQEDHDNWRRCVDKEGSSCSRNKPQEIGDTSLGIPEEFIRCFDFTGIFKSREGQGWLGQIGGIQPDTCQRSNGMLGTENYACIKNDTENFANNRFDNIFNTLDYNLRARPHTHCLPHENLEDEYDSKDKNDPAFYVQPIDTVRAGYGCGGLAFQLECNEHDAANTSEDWFLPGGVKWSETSPTLVIDESEE